MSLITRSIIIEMYHEEIQRCKSLVEHWAHNPTKLVIKKSRTKFGTACSDGTITISEAFVMTHESDHLRNTIRHEIAHLIAGCRNSHNHRWHKACAQIGCNAEVTSTAKDLLAHNMKARYTLIAHLEGGHTVRLQRQTRQRKYMQYSYNGNSRDSFTINNTPVIKFEYKEN